jgi:hypothetical protein
VFEARWSSSCGLTFESAAASGELRNAAAAGGEHVKTADGLPNDILDVIYEITCFHLTYLLDEYKLYDKR